MTYVPAERLPDWRPLHAATRAWLLANGHPSREYHVRDVDHAYGVSHEAPRVRTYVVKLRYRTETQYVVVAMPAGLRVDMTATRKTMLAESGWMATLGEVTRFAGSGPFCVPPIADVSPLPVVLDSRVAVAPEIFVPSGRPSHVVRIAPAALGGTRGLLLLQVEGRQLRVWPPHAARSEMMSTDRVRRVASGVPSPAMARPDLVARRAATYSPRASAAIAAVTTSCTSSGSCGSRRSSP